MKPKAFDDLIRSRYDEGDFAYNPQNWEKLAKQLDEKKPSKSRMLLWLPMAAIVSLGSIAAAMAMIITIPALVHHRADQSVAAAHKPAVQAFDVVVDNTPTAANQACKVPAGCFSQNTFNTTINAKNIATAPYNQHTAIENLVSGDHNLQLLPNTINKNLHLAENILNGTRDNAKIKSNKLNFFAYSDHMSAPEYTVEKKSAKSAVSLVGGLNYGAQTAGYTVGVSGKTMIGKHMFVEGDIAFVNNSTNAKTEYTYTTVVPSAKLAVAPLAKQLNITGNTDNTPTIKETTVSKPTSFGMYYAQFTPSLGYNMRKHVSVSAGADMQQLLQNTSSGTPDVVTDKVVPQFDMGIVAKTECKLSGRLKAAVYYRHGITNVIMPYDKYMDRNYMQFQLKYTILNK